MKVEHLKLILDQYKDGDLVLLRLSIGTAHRIDNAQIESLGHDPDLYTIQKAKRDEKTSSLVLEIE